VTFNARRDPSPTVFQLPGSYPLPIYGQERPIQLPDEREFSDDNDDADVDDGDGDGPASCPSTPQRGSQSINADVKAIITRTADVNKLEHKTGSVYIFLATHNGNPIVKIGSTANQVKSRKRNIQTACTALQFQPQPAHLPPQDITSHLQHVERLAQAELQDCRYDFDCSCRTQHREWFTVDPEVAHRVVARWIRFCEQKPWDCHPGEPRSYCTGPLKTHWRDRLDHWKPALSTPTAACDLETRLALCDKIFDVNGWDVAWNDVRRWSRGVWQHLVEAAFVLVLVVFAAGFQWCGRPWLATGVMWLLVVLLFYVVLKVGGFRSWMVERLLGG
jgi:hypothetical protein